MNVKITDIAKQFVDNHGGKVFVRTKHNRCCSGTLTMLEITTAEPADADRFVACPSSEVDVRYLAGPGVTPSELSIDLKGRRRPRLEAYWDGCRFRL